MKRCFLFLNFLACSSLLFARTAQAEEALPPDHVPAVDGAVRAQNIPGLDPFELKRFYDELATIRTQRLGYILFGAGLVASLTGVLISQIDSLEQPVGTASFITLGAGIGLMTTGMFLLGFSDPITYYTVHNPRRRRR